MEFGLIGEKLGHSYSPQIHRCFGEYDYQLYPMPEKDMEALLHGRPFRGLNVTIPYKQKVLPFCDEISDAVRQIGSANTLVNRGGHLFADNTDLPGFLFLLKKAGIEIAEKKAVILGSGGTSLTARAALTQLKAKEIVVVSRKGPVTYEDLYARHTDADVLINATPVGMYPDTLVSPVRLDMFPRLSGVADVIYNPGKTALILDAEERGIPCAGGLWMLAAQAWHAAKLFLNREIPEEKLKEAYASVFRETRNLVLIGMPGGGKSTLGRLIAREMGKPFVDLDEEIVKIAGPIPEIFEKQGEAGFREIESQIVRQFGKESGLVIAAGGGAVLKRENVRALRQNGVIFWVQRPIEKLSRKGRPLSAGGVEALKSMAETRMPIYAACADFIVRNEGTKAAAVAQLREGFHEAADS